MFGRVKIFIWALIKASLLIVWTYFISDFFLRGSADGIAAAVGVLAWLFYSWSKWKEQSAATVARDEIADEICLTLLERGRAQDRKIEELQTEIAKLSMQVKAIAHPEHGYSSLRDNIDGPRPESLLRTWSNLKRMRNGWKELAKHHDCLATTLFYLELFAILWIAAIVLFGDRILP